MKPLWKRTLNRFLFLVALILVSLSLVFIDYFSRVYLLNHWVSVFLGISITFCLLVIIRQNQDNERFDKMVEAVFHLPYGLVVCDDSDHIYWLNGAAEKILGEIEPLSDIRLQTLLPNIPLQPFFETEVKSYALIAELRPKRFWSLVCTRYIGEGSIISFTEITASKKVEEDRKWIFSNLSHELRIPLTVLQGYIELLEDARKEQKYEKADLRPYRHMQNQVDRLLSLVNQITTLNKIQVNKSWGKKTWVDVPDMLYSLYDEIQLKNRKQNKLSLHLDDELLVYAYENSLREVILNLVYNAIEHNPKKTAIAVYWQKVTLKEKTYAYFAVQDDGIGIPREHLQFLTQRFYVVSSDRNRGSNSGSGLGLAIVDQALKAHDAELKIESTLGKGSSFSFILPLDFPPKEEKDR